MNKKIKLLAFFFIVSTATIAQSIISGTILNQETSLPIPDVNIKIANQSVGATSSGNGSFNFQISKSKAQIIFTAIGFKTKQIAVRSNKGQIKLGIIYLQPIPYSLDEISINAGLSNTKNIPVSVSTISAKQIREKLGHRPLPMIMQGTPGIFSIRNGGGSGDAKLTIRGFQQEDVSLLLNGIPINGQENGLVYWSNWLGLSAAAAEIQIQKGPGLSNASTGSVGGSINIITLNAPKQKSASLFFEMSNYGNLSTSITINSGQLTNGWNTSLMFTYNNGPGWVNATFIKSFAYFFTAQKQLDKKNKLTITLIGAPQTHGQRTIKLSALEVNTYGLAYNKDWGSYNGKIKNASVNFYHKPFLSIVHSIKINNKNNLSTSLYFSVGYGGGRWSESFNYAPSIFTYRNYSGQINWHDIYKNNATHKGSYTLENGSIVSGYSLNVQTNFLASHIQTGFITNFEHKISHKFTFIGGIHYRYFKSFLREEIDDLLGGKFFIEDYSWSLAGVDGRNQIKTIGDIIHVNNNSIINSTSAYSRLLYNDNKINTFISVNVVSKWYRRDDRFNYVENTMSKTVIKQGWDLRTGFLFKINQFQSIYTNVAVISKVPYFKYVFGNFTNVVVQNLKNETIKTIEIGYKLNWNFITADFTTYVTSRQNISMLSNEYVQLENNTQTRAMINGLNALHKGLELNINMEINQNIKVGGIAALGDFKWQNNVSARLFNDNNVVVDTVNVYAKGLAIGGTAQQQLGLFIKFNMLKTIYLNIEYLYFGSMFADFDATSRNNPHDTSQPFQLPSHSIINTYLVIPFTVVKYYGKLQISTYNLLNSKHIVMGQDGSEHNLQTFRGFWSFNRNFNFSIMFNF